MAIDVWRQRGADMRRHVVRPFGGVAVIHALPGQTREEILQILLHIGIGIFLDQQRSRSVADEAGEKTVADFLAADEFRHRVGEFVKPGTMGVDLDGVKGLFHPRFPQIDIERALAAMAACAGAVPATNAANSVSFSQRGTICFSTPCGARIHSSAFLGSWDCPCR